jgi:membrane fusion protein, multidrug efflux system
MTDASIQNQETSSGGDSESGGTGVGPGRPPARRTKSRRRILFTVLGFAIIASVILLYRHFAEWESTDDAQIDGYIYPVSPRISGYVTRVMVDDNQYVKAGTVLVVLDGKDYEVALANAKASLANDQANAAAVATNVPITSVNTSSQLSGARADVDSATAGLVAAQRGLDASQATLRQAEANDLKAQDDVQRSEPLAEKDEIPQQLYTQALDAQKATAAAVEAVRQNAAAAAQAVTQARAKLAQAQAQLQSAHTRPQQISAQHSRALAAEAETQRAAAVLQQAQLNLQYTTIVAPVSGIIGQR